MTLAAPPRIRRAAVCACAAAVLAPAASARADSLTLALDVPSTPVVGRPMILTARGTIPLRDLAYAYWFSLDAIPIGVMSRCPEDRWAAVQVAGDTGGSVIVQSQREPADAAGHFSIPVGITPSAPGRVRLCAYTDDGETHTLAIASAVLDIQPRGTTPAAGRAAQIRADARSAIRGCRALLPSPGSCVRVAVRRANARCRRLPSRRTRTACLAGVRRLATGR